MSDFLTRLVERTLGLSEAVQPLITPIFSDRLSDRDASPETPPIDEEILDIESKTEFSHFKKTEVSPSSDELLTQSREITETVPEKPADVDKHLASAPSLMQKKVARESFPKLKKPDSYDGSPSDEKDREIISPEIGVSENGVMPDRIVLGLVRVPQEEEKRQELAANPRRWPRSSGLAFENKKKETPAKFTFSEKADTGANRKAFSTAPAVLGRIIRPGISVRRERTEKEGISSERPAIKVTIGRIDVRAIKQQTISPPRHKPNSKSKLSLDNYLKQRDRGEP